ncbi:MAG: protoglobin domain-containing protein [Candidatus Competibacter sp.]|nr:protoglobin domain-containing protein [Candidatus Competibacter sp.]MDG4583349.1 protoglobin domain-containing protein [Candidatus Competibacter sp.]
MSHLAQAPGDEATAAAVPPWFPDRNDIDLLWRIGLFSADDARALRKVWRILKGQTDDYLDRLLGMVAAYPALAAELAVLRGECWERGTVDDSVTLRRWFRQWLFETCVFPQDPPWLRQVEMNSPAQPVSAPLPGFRYVVALVFPLVMTARPFLVASGNDHTEIERMQYALLKAILLQATLLGKLYVKEGLW